MIGTPTSAHRRETARRAWMCRETVEPQPQMTGFRLHDRHPTLQALPAVRRRFDRCQAQPGAGSGRCPGVARTMERMCIR